MNRTRLASVLLCGIALCGVGQAAENSRDVARKISLAVARVGLVWSVDERYAALQKELSEKYSNVPSWEQFKLEERWIIATARDPVVLSGTFKSRSKAEMNIQLGDIVELKVSDRKSVNSYQELTTVTKILCKFGAPDFEECSKANPVAWFDKEGKLLEQP